MADVVFVFQGWWHPDVWSGQVHDHPEQPGPAAAAAHRLCEAVYTRWPQATADWVMLPPAAQTALIDGGSPTPITPDREVRCHDPSAS